MLYNFNSNILSFVNFRFPSAQKERFQRQFRDRYVTSELSRKRKEKCYRPKKMSWIIPTISRDDSISIIEDSRDNLGNNKNLILCIRNCKVDVNEAITLALVFKKNHFLKGIALRVMKCPGEKRIETVRLNAY